MFQNCPSFQKATEMFYSMHYDQGLLLITQCIAKDTHNSILYSNRALFYSQLDYIQQALEDLNMAIHLNHLNYIAYFNMFSLLMRIQKFDQAFDNLCCSLSCLYLIRAKTKKSQLDASKAIKYAQNNMQAHVLKGLIHMQNGKYKLALNELDWACEINPGHEIVRNIRSMIWKKMNPGLEVKDEELEEDYGERNLFIRLESSYSFEQNDKEKQLRDKIIQFNEIYNNLNEFQGTITTKVPKDQLYNQSNDTLQTNTNVQSSSAYQFKIDENSTQVTSAKSPQALPQIIAQESLNHQKQSNQNSSTIMEDNSTDMHKETGHGLAQQVAQRLIYNQILTDEQLIFDKIPQSGLHINLFYRQSSQFNNHSQAIIADQGLATPSRVSIGPQPGHYINESQNIENQIPLNLSRSSKNYQSNPDKQSNKQADRFSQFQSMIHSNNDHQKKDFEDNFQSLIDSSQRNTISQEASVISNALYPKQKNCMLQFSILKLELVNISAQKMQQLQNLYCIANYLNSREGANSSKFKLRTACQKGFETGTQWNETFDPIEIPESPECMKIKVYNKKYSSYRDDLIGQMEVQITTHGIVKLPLFNKKGELSGSLLMNLQLVYGPIEEQEQTDA